MSCSLLALAACAAGLYLDGSLAALDSGVEQYRRDTTVVVLERNGFRQLAGTRVSESYSHEALNPYGRLAIGYEQPFFTPTLRLSAELFHESSIATGRDRGVNGGRISLRWYPWGGVR
jgi:hypothetical protein